jgi:hypothetical protein
VAVQKKARDAITRALRETDYSTQEPLFEIAFASVEFPKGDVPIDPKELTDDQRALCRLFVDAELHSAALAGYAVPWRVGDRRRWLGLDPPRRLEQRVAGAPLWRTIALLRAEDVERAGAFLNKLPIDARLEAFGEIESGAYDLDVDDIFHQGGVRLVEDLGRSPDKGKKWATRALDAAAAALASPRVVDGLVWSPSSEYRLVAFEAIARSKAPIKREWEAMLPIVEAPYATAKRITMALDRTRRDDIVATALRAGHPNLAMTRAMELVVDFPSRPLFEAIFDLCEKVERPVRRVLPDLKKAAGKNQELRELVDARMRGKPKPLALAVVRRITVRKDDELTKVQRTQLRAARRQYGDEMESLAECPVSITELARSDGAAAYAIFEIMGDSGCVFEAGTTKIVATIVQRGVECDDARLREAFALARGTKKKRR